MSKKAQWFQHPSEMEEDQIAEFAFAPRQSPKKRASPSRDMEGDEMRPRVGLFGADDDSYARSPRAKKSTYASNAPRALSNRSPKKRASPGRNMEEDEMRPRVGLFGFDDDSYSKSPKAKRSPIRRPQTPVQLPAMDDVMDMDVYEPRSSGVGLFGSYGGSSRSRSRNLRYGCSNSMYEPMNP